MSKHTSIERSLYIYSFAICCGAILGFSIGQLVIWPALLVVKWSAPGVNVHLLATRFGRPIVLVFIVIGIIRGLRSAHRIVTLPDE